MKLFLIKKTAAGDRGVLAAKIGQQIEVEYVLRKSVNQQPDADALPPQSDLEKAIVARGQAVVDREGIQ